MVNVIVSTRWAFQRRGSFHANTTSTAASTSGRGFTAAVFFRWAVHAFSLSGGGNSSDSHPCFSGRTRLATRIDFACRPVHVHQCSGATDTFVTGISGDNIVGYTSQYQGFLYDNGTYTGINPPGSVLTVVTGASGNNVVGSYDNGTSTVGFLESGGSYTTISPPGSSSATVTGVSGDNVAGYGAINGGGFLYNQGTYTIINPPGSTSTTVIGVSGDNVVGTFNNGHIYQGFLYNDGTITAINVPGFLTQTIVSGVSGNTVYGFYQSDSGAQQGFLYDSGTYTTLDIVPGFTNITGVSGSAVVGNYNVGGNQYGFLYQGGNTITLDPANSTDVFVTGIDGNEIVGYYRDGNQQAHGFEYAFSPAPEPSSLALIGMAGLMWCASRKSTVIRRILANGNAS